MTHKSRPGKKQNRRTCPAPRDSSLTFNPRRADTAERAGRPSGVVTRKARVLMTVKVGEALLLGGPRAPALLPALGGALLVITLWAPMCAGGERGAGTEKGRRRQRRTGTYHSVQELVVIGADRLPVQQHAATLQRVEVLQDVDAGTLPAARGPNERGHLAWAQAEGDVLQGTPRGRVGPPAPVWPQTQAGALPSRPVTLCQGWALPGPGMLSFLAPSSTFTLVSSAGNSPSAESHLVGSCSWFRG